MSEGSGVFGILIAAIAFIIVLFLAYTYFLPFLNPPIDLSKEVKNGFAISQANEGKVSEEKKLFLKASQSINAKNFDDSSTIAVLECNNPAICCIDEENCSSALSINTAFRGIFVKKDILTSVFYRCMFDRKAFVCKAFFGVKPAQVEIKSLKVPATIDLGKNNALDLEINIQNSGALPNNETMTAIVKVFNASDTNPSKEPLLEASQEIGKLQAGESKTQKMQLLLSSPGKLEVRVSVSGENSGSDLKKAIVQASGIPATGCAALGRQAPEFYSSSGSIEELKGKCVSKALCGSCSTSFECRQAWLSREAVVVSANSDYAYVVLQDSQCQ
ncbi:MAG: hypothetical protein Q7R70_06295 [Candidatus Diapherotrites archaeon]|nr:hypothetical protein [Candidatus Diapherotrites archaeon]